MAQGAWILAESRRIPPRTIASVIGPAFTVNGRGAAGQDHSTFDMAVSSPPSQPFGKLRAGSSPIKGGRNMLSPSTGESQRGGGQLHGTMKRPMPAWAD